MAFNIIIGAILGGSGGAPDHINGPPTTIFNTVMSADPTGSVAIELQADGDAFRLQSDVSAAEPFSGVQLADWVIPTKVRTWHVKVTQNSGDTLEAWSDSLATWLPMTSDYKWGYAGTGSGNPFKEGNFDFDYSIDGGSTVHDSRAGVTITLDLIIL